MDRLLTVEEVAQLLRISPKTVYEWTSERYIPHIKMKGCLRFCRKEIEKWLKDKTIRGRNTRRARFDRPLTEGEEYAKLRV